MYRLALFFFIIALINSGKPVHAQPKDTIFLFNGQVLIGQIKQGKFGEISIDDVDLKVVRVKQFKIKFLTTSGQFRIETTSKKGLVGRMKKSPREGYVSIIVDDGTVFETDIIGLSTIVALEENFFSQLNGNISAGFSYTKSSGIGQVNLSSTVQYVTRLIGYQLTTSVNGSLDSSGYSRDREEVGLFTAYNFTPSWFAALGLDYQRNLELSIARRYLLLIGGGNQVLLRQYAQMYVISGLAMNQEHKISGVSGDLLWEIPVALRFNFFKYSHPNLQISAAQTVFFSLTQKGRVRYTGNTSISWQMIRDFYLTVNPYSNFDNEEHLNFDYGMVLSLTYKF